jgi:hypothetical protein
MSGDTAIETNGFHGTRKHLMAYFGTQLAWFEIVIPVGTICHQVAHHATMIAFLTNVLFPVSVVLFHTTTALSVR